MMFKTYRQQVEELPARPGEEEEIKEFRALLLDGASYFAGWNNDAPTGRCDRKDICGPEAVCCDWEELLLGQWVLCGEEFCFYLVNGVRVGEDWCGRLQNLTIYPVNRPMTEGDLDHWVFIWECVAS